MISCNHEKDASSFSHNIKIKIAIPVENNRLHSHFEGSTHFALVEVSPKTKQILDTQILAAPKHVPGAFPHWLQKQGVQVVIVGGIKRRALAIFAHHGIEARMRTPNATVEELVEAYLNNQLQDQLDACKHHHHHHHHHGGHGHGHRHGHGHKGGYGRGHGRGRRYAHQLRQDGKEKPFQKRI